MTNPISKIPNINVPMTVEDQRILLELKHHYEHTQQRRVSIAEIVRAALRELYKKHTATA